MLQKIRTADWQLTADIAKLPGLYRPFWLAVTQLGGVIVVSLVIAVAIFLSYQAGQYTIAWVYVLTIIATGVNFLLKVQFRRRRPDTEYAKAMRTKTYSFPSGHAFGSMVTYGLSAMVLMPYVTTELHAAVWAAAVVIIGAIGFSRVYLGAHYVLDVVGGWVLGLVYLSILRYSGLA